MPLASPKRRRSSAGGLTKVAGVVAGAIGLALIAGVVWFNLAHPPLEIDKDTLCLKSGPLSTTVVLIDVSDPLPPLAQEDVKNEIFAAAGEVPKLGLLELRLLDPETEGGKVLFSRCNPGDGRELSEFIANPELERKRFEQDFARPLQSLLGSAVQSGPADTSPIMETLQWIAVKSRSPGGEGLSRLFVVSDMIQHSDEYSLYKGDPGFDRFRRSPAYQRLRTDLHGAEAEVFFVHRAKAGVMDNDLVEFWERWFADNNGSLVRVRKIEGTE
jgi:hypothetical protein